MTTTSEKRKDASRESEIMRFPADQPLRLDSGARLDNLEIGEALLLHALAASGTGHALHGNASELITASKAIHELW